MATYLRLFDPTQQFQLKNGALNVSGRLYVYLEGTDDYAALYDENGSQLQQPVVLDNNGRSAGLFVDSKKTYWMKVNDQYDGTIFTIRKMTPCGGGGGSVLAGTYDVVSTDGSIAIDKSVDAGNTTFDLTKPSDSTELLEWFRSDSYYKLPDTNIYRPSCTKGTMETGDVGVEINANQYYHVTGHIWASKDEGREPFYDEITIKYMLRGEGQYDQLVMSSKVIVDYSLGLSQEFEVSTDVIPDEDCELYVVVENQNVNNGNFGLKDMEIHRICSGSPSIPSGVLSRARAAEIYQRKLIAGQNITITETEEGDIIASTGGGGGGGGATYQGGEGIIVNNTTYRISIDDSVVQEKLTAGDNITISNNVISATVPSVDISGKADKVEDAVNGNLAGLDSNGNLTDSGIAADRVVQDASYVHTDQNFTTELKNKLVNIEAGAEVNVQSDWLEENSSSDAYIRNKPDMSQYATTADISGKADKVSGAVDGNLAGLDSTGNLTDSGISASDVATQTDLAGKQDTLIAGNNITIVDNVISATGGGSFTQVQSNWNESDSSAVSYIQNKPTIPSGNQLLPAATSADENKVLTVDSNGDPTWAVAPSGADVVLDANSTWNDFLTAYNAGKRTIYFSMGSGPVGYYQFYTANITGTPSTSYAVFVMIDVDTSDHRLYTTTMKGNGTRTSSVVYLESVQAGTGLSKTTTSPGSETRPILSVTNPLPSSSSQDATKVLTVASNGTAQWTPAATVAPVQDVTVGGTSVVSGGTAAIPAQVQSNWTEADSSAVSYVQNKPTEINLIAGTGISLTMTAQGLVISLA